MLWGSMAWAQGGHLIDSLGLSELPDSPTACIWSTSLCLLQMASRGCSQGFPLLPELGLRVQVHAGHELDGHGPCGPGHCPVLVH